MSRFSSESLTPSAPLDIRLGLTNHIAPDFKIRWGIVGAGKISTQWVKILQSCKGARVSAIAARDPGRAAAFASTFKVENIFVDYDSMFQSDEVDIVYIGTVPDTHKDLVLSAIQAGKHVLCEKPFSANVSDAKEMHEAALTKNLMCIHGLWTRFFPAVEHARHALDNGLIGEVLMVQSDFDPIYTIAHALLAFGSDETPNSIMVTKRHCVLEYDEWRSAVLSFPAFPSEFPEVTEITGTKGRITLEQPCHCPTRITLRTPEKVPSRYLKNNTPAPATHFDYPLPDSVGIEGAYPNQRGFIYQAEAIHRCLAAKLTECPQFTTQDSLSVLALLEQVNKLRGKVNPFRPYETVVWGKEEDRL